MRLIRALVVDDHEPFRRLIGSLLENSRVTIVGQASDGLEAVQKAALLQPDLILLDIDLPKLNGIPAAEQIREIAPQSKLLLLAQDNSRDVIQAALNMGAIAYLHKTFIHRDLLPAIESVLAGKRFVRTDPEVL